MGKPDRQLTDPTALLLGFLDYYRSVVTTKITGLSGDELRTSRLPSGWTPLELVNHLVHMEHRWLCWGFRAEPTAEPFADSDGSGRWRAGPEITAGGLVAALEAAGARTREIVTSAAWTDIAATGGRFNDGDRHPPPSLAWILVYVLQEYARHAGHLDIARELADGETGE